MIATPELAALQDLCDRLELAGVAYMLTGSLAMSYYARPRMTRDIDLVVSLDVEQVARLARTLGADYHADEDALRAAIGEARPWNIIHLPSLVKIDLIPRKSSDYRLVEFGRRQKIQIAGIALWIVSVEDLIISKLEWQRQSRSEQQRGDVRLLLQTPLDRVYLEHWILSLELGDLLKDIERE